MSNAQGITLEAFQTMVSVRLNKDYTEEQLQLARDFTKPTISFSMPGTGKTSTALLGLFTAELYHKVPAENIYALSFTRMATLELRLRHEEESRKLGIRSKVNFKTLSALCRKILLDNYEKLGFSEIEVTESFTVAEMHDFLLEAAEERGLQLPPWKVRSVIRAIRSLNSSLIFDRQHVESKKVFKDTGLSYDDFSMLRKDAYDLNKAVQRIQMSDVLLYTLELLTRAPEVSEKLKSQIRVLLVDEFQDMSLLQLRLLTMMTENLVVIGDIRQQIYAFNGACQQIEQQYLKYFPNANRISLTQSFRCGREIAEYGTSLILPNRTGGEEFKGRDIESKVKFHNHSILSELARELYEDFSSNNNVFSKETMFVFRNNYSAIPLAEEFYKLRLPFRINNYVPAHQIPVIKDLCAVVELISVPNQLSNLKCLPMLFPEFKEHDSWQDTPIYKIMRQTGESFFDIKFQFRNQEHASVVYRCLRDAKDLLEENQPVSEVFNAIWPALEPHFAKEEYRLEQEISYYTGLVAPLLKLKTYRQFTTEELRKQEFIEENNVRHIGVRCYTMHAAKGTEADIVHILDANEGLIPNQNKIDEMLEADCYVDAAREIHNERCLVYVAVTRAKEELNIHYSGELSSLFTTNNKYNQLDDIYEQYNPDYNDVEVFERFFRGESLDAEPNYFNSFSD